MVSCDNSIRYSNSKHLVKTIIITGIGFVCTYMVDFISTPYITDALGTDAYGYVSLAKQFSVYAMIISTAINSYVSRYIGVEYHKKNFERSNLYFGTAIISNVVLGMMAVFFSIVFSYYFTYFFDIRDMLLSDVRLLFIFIFINYGIVNVSTAMTSSYYVANRLDKNGIVKMLADIVELLVLLILIKLYAVKTYYIAIALIVRNTIVLIFAYYNIERLTPNLSLKRIHFDTDSFKRLIVNGVWNSMNSVGNTLNSGLDLIITNAYIGGAAMGEIAIVKVITNIAGVMFQLVAQPFQPLLLKAYAMNDKKLLIKELKISMKMSSFLGNLFFGLVVAIGLKYYKLWVPKQNCFLLYKLTIIGCINCVFEGIVTPLYYIYTLEVKNRFPCVVTIIGGLVNVFGMIVLLKFTTLGIYSILITTTVVMSFISLVTNPIYMAYCLKMHWGSFYSNIFRCAVSAVVMCIVFGIVSAPVHIESWVMMLAWAVLLSVIGIIIHYFVVTSKEEKTYILERIKKMTNNIGGRNESV